MNAKFLAALRSAGPTQYEQGQRLCLSFMEACDQSTASGGRYEDAIVAAYMVFLTLCEDSGYDHIAIEELIAAKDRAGKMERTRRIG